MSKSGVGRLWTNSTFQQEFRKTRTIFLPRSFMVALLSFVYTLGFIITPYWALIQPPTRMLFFLGLIIIVGIAWIYTATNSLEIQFDFNDFLVGCLSVAGIVALNYRQLTSVIPFKGDDGFHIDRTLELVGIIPFKWIIGALVSFAVVMYLSIKKPRLAIFISIPVILSLILFFQIQNPFGEMEQSKFFLRYPFINYWFFAFVPKITSIIINPYHEILFRLIPVLSIGILAWSFQKRVEISDVPTKFVLALCAATVPSVFYYSSILYIEPPAILMMTIVCLDIINLTHLNGREVTRNPNWYALILIGFIKETTAPFLLCFLACREIIQLRKWYTAKEGKSLLAFLAEELGIIFSVLVPVVLYLYFRSELTSTRSYIPHLSNLFDPSIYPQIVRSFLEQFGVFCFFFLCGCILLTASKDYSTLFIQLSLIVASLAFFIMDDKVYVGYSRFNLYIFPPILAVASIFIRWIFLQKRILGILLIFLALLVNLLISPINLDGTKAPYWGNYMIDTSEHYYPYEDAFLWLRDNDKNGQILFTGLDFQYSFQFYWNKLDWHPSRDGIQSDNSYNETIAVSKILEKAERENFDFVVYRVLGQDFTQPYETNGFQSKIFRNSAHTLIIYYKKQ